MPASIKLSNYFFWRRVFAVKLFQLLADSWLILKHWVRHLDLDNFSHRCR